MKVLFLSAANSIHTVRWVNALSERGHKITLVSQKNHQADADSIHSDVDIRYLPVSGTKGYYLNARALNRIYKQGNFDVINVHYASGYGTLARVARLPRILLSVWGSDVYDFPYESSVKEKILRKNLKYAAMLASTSKAMAKQTQKFLNENKEIKITPFGVDIKKFSPDKRKKENDKFVFGIIKTLSPKYGIDTVIKAFAQFYNEISDQEKGKVCLQIYGKGELLEELKKLTRTLKIEEHVIFKGYIPNDKVPRALNDMDVFLLGSRFESFGVAAVEAMACGIPIVATDADGFKEVIKGQETGFIVPKNAPEKMAPYLKILYDDDELRKRMGAAGRKRVETLYNWDKNVETMIEAYQNLI